MILFSSRKQKKSHVILLPIGKFNDLYYYLPRGTFLIKNFAQKFIRIATFCKWKVTRFQVFSKQKFRWTSLWVRPSCGTWMCWNDIVWLLDTRGMHVWTEQGWRCRWENICEIIQWWPYIDKTFLRENLYLSVQLNLFFLTYRLNHYRL